MSTEPASRNAARAPPAVAVSGLTRRFGDLVAVDGLDLEIPGASIYGFLGPNGSGKSTAIRMLCGLLRPDAGRIRVLGLEIPRRAEALRRRVGYMTQRFSLYEDLSVRENLAFLGRIHGYHGRTLRARIGERLDRYGLGGRADQAAGTLSGGERQRLALAGATFHDPELLFLDEPTSAVDPESRREFWEHLFDLVADGATILVSSHFMDEAERCHRLAILDEGRLVAEGEPERLMAEIPARVVEILAPAPRRVREAVLALDAVLHVAQLGTRLHALLDPAVPEPAALLARTLRERGLEGETRAVPANLEDVFVMATVGPRLAT
ncbi:MAG: ABC transporter ATP-binding protein [Pseudomonadales bacterium]|nr:ABC transporter ATP-binding protein [Pseudomonadales bacterium]